MFIGSPFFGARRHTSARSNCEVTAAPVRGSSRAKIAGARKSDDFSCGDGCPAADHECARHSARSLRRTQDATNPLDRFDHAGGCHRHSIRRFEHGGSCRTRSADRLESVQLLPLRVLPTQLPTTAGEQRQLVLQVQPTATNPGSKQELVQLLQHRSTVLPRSSLHLGCVLTQRISNMT